mmetsp:Transcript_9498/g.14257  ORF Transcript_9498/g.14257 Transcript_9498/m.14257 type:complete len:468 (+) Transcript_9498:23-1426(+)
MKGFRCWLAAIALGVARGSGGRSAILRRNPYISSTSRTFRRLRSVFPRSYTLNSPRHIIRPTAEAPVRKGSSVCNADLSQPSWSVIRGCKVEDVSMIDANGATVIDLRAPVEYAEDHHPAAVNVPLLDNDERAIVGTIYKQISPEEAFDKGVGFVEKRLENLVNDIRIAANMSLSKEEKSPSEVFSEVAGQVRYLKTETEANAVPQKGDVVVYCARGGQRSRSVAALLQRLGWKNVWLMEGGYKNFRRYVRETLDSSIANEIPEKIVVLSGMTGVGKTRILNRVESFRPNSTLDLEGIAGHRSSLLGHVGLKPASQKSFETNILRRLLQGFPNGYAVVESESRKVGDSVIPEKIWRELERATKINLVAPLDVRVTRLCEEYLRDEHHRNELEKALPQLEYVMKGKNENEFVTMLRRGEERALTALLIEKWYDSRYRDRAKDAVATIDTSDEIECAEAVVDAIENKLL